MMISRVVNCWLFALAVLLSFCVWMQRDATAEEKSIKPAACAKRKFTTDECATIANIGAGALMGRIGGLTSDKYHWDDTQGDLLLQCRLREVVSMAFDGSQDGVHPKRYGMALYQECTRPLVEARL